MKHMVRANKKFSSVKSAVKMTNWLISIWFSLVSLRSKFIQTVGLSHCPNLAYLDKNPFVFKNNLYKFSKNLIGLNISYAFRKTDALLRRGIIKTGN